MIINRPSLVRLMWPLFGVPFAFALFCLVSYKVTPPLPFNSQAGTVIWFVVFASVIFSGVPVIGGYFTGRVWLKVLLVLLYILLMSAVLFFVGLWSACLRGDCL